MEIDLVRPEGSGLERSDEGRVNVSEREEVGVERLAFPKGISILL